MGKKIQWWAQRGRGLEPVVRRKGKAAPVESNYRFDTPLDLILLERRFASDGNMAIAETQALMRIVPDDPNHGPNQQLVEMLNRFIAVDPFGKTNSTICFFSSFDRDGLEFDGPDDTAAFIRAWIERLGPLRDDETLARMTMCFRLALLARQLYLEHRWCGGEEKRRLKMAEEPFLDTMTLWSLAPAEPPCKFRRLLEQLKRLALPSEAAAALLGVNAEHLDELLFGIESGELDASALWERLREAKTPEIPTLMRGIAHAFPAFDGKEHWQIPRADLFKGRHELPARQVESGGNHTVDPTVAALFLEMVQNRIRAEAREPIPAERIAAVAHTFARAFLAHRGCLTGAPAEGALENPSLVLNATAAYIAYDGEVPPCQCLRLARLLPEQKHDRIIFTTLRALVPASRVGELIACEVELDPDLLRIQALVGIAERHAAVLAGYPVSSLFSRLRQWLEARVGEGYLDEYFRRA